MAQRGENSDGLANQFRNGGKRCLQPIIANWARFSASLSVRGMKRWVLFDVAVQTQPAANQSDSATKRSFSLQPASLAVAS